jgi:CRISPR-associated protein Cas2
MIVLVLTACPAGLRGYLTRWLLEISPGVFTGHTSTRVRELLWQNTVDMIKDGRAIMVYSARNEQHLEFRVHRHDWVPTDFDGIRLMMRPNQAEHDIHKSGTGLRSGWSNQAKWRMGRRHAKSSK